MANELALIEPIQLPANPDPRPSWPAWLQHRNDVLVSGTGILPNGLPDPFEPPTLPAELILNSSERAMVEGHIAGLSRFLDVNQPFVHRETLLTNDQAIGALIAGLLIKKKGAKLDKAASDALTEDYLDALEDDIPAWTVRAALRKWNRGESVRVDPKKPHDFIWSPDPPTLRYLCRAELASIKWDIFKMQRLLSATVRPTEQQLETGRAAMQGLNRLIKAGDLEGAKALTFEAAAVLGREPDKLIAPPSAAQQPADAYQEAGE